MADAKKDGIQDTPDSMFAYLVERVRNNLHVILCMSPVGEPFRCGNVCLYPVLTSFLATNARKSLLSLLIFPSLQESSSHVPSICELYNY